MICDKCDKKFNCEEPCDKAIEWRELEEEYRIKEYIKGRTSTCVVLQSYAQSRIELKQKTKIEKVN